MGIIKLTYARIIFIGQKEFSTRTERDGDGLVPQLWNTF